MAQRDIQNLRTLFGDGVTRGSVTAKAESYTRVTLADIDGLSVAPTGSFELDPPSSPLKSTQQIPLDFSRFENHTFFNSAESNVNVAFQRIINGYPFDGTRTEREAFLQSLTGFEKYVYDSFPKSKNFSRFTANDTNFITVKDFEGTTFSSLARNPSGRGALDPGLSSIAFEMQFFSPEEATPSAVIAQKLSGQNGISLVASKSDGSTIQTVDFYVSSASIGLSASMDVPKGQFNHIVAQFNRQLGQQRLELYSNSRLIATSSTVASLGSIDFSTSNLYIGSGSTHTSPGFEDFEPTSALTGAIDEFRIFHTTRSVAEQKSHARKSIYPQSSLKLYLKLNEATGSYSGNIYALDSSGNSLHGTYPNSTIAAAARGSSGEFSDVANPMTLELLSESPVLFPTYDDVVALNTTLLTSASQYDANNPNLITRLIPQHYLLESSAAEGFANEDAETGDPLIADNDFPGGSKIPSSQIIASLLFTYAKFFDELKIFIDHISSLRFASYDDKEGVASNFLVQMAEEYGFDLPSNFTSATFAQFLLAQNLGVDEGVATKSLREVQNILWRRFLVSLPEILRSRGTMAGVRGILNTLGLEDQKIFRLIEYGGRNASDIATAKIDKTIELKYLDFSGSLSGGSTTDSSGFASQKPVIRSTYLSASRFSPGTPTPEGTITPAGSDNQNDGLFTSSSFTVEGIFRFSSSSYASAPFLTQSLFRLLTTGTKTSPSVVQPSLLANVVAHVPVQKQGITGTLFAYASETQNLQSAPLSMSLQGVDIFDGNAWHIAFGRKKINATSSSYFLKARKSGLSNPAIFSVSQRRAHQGASGDVSAFSNINAEVQASGCFIAIGSQSIEQRPSYDYFLNGSSFPDDARSTQFAGQLSQLRFWSKALEEKELASHARSPDNLGVDDPNINFAFGDTLSGSFERLRIAATMQQPTTSSNAAGNITLFDFSLGESSGTLDTPIDKATGSRLLKYFVTGTGFEASARVIKKRVQRSISFSPQFDVNASDNKVQIEELDDPTSAEQLGARTAQDRDYLLPTEAVPDNRFLVEVSANKALDEDIMHIFGTLQALEDAIGSPEKAFDYEYSDLRHLREIYFNRLSEKINVTTFFDFFRFFDDTLSSMLQSVVPQNTNFLGIRFVISPHALERGKLKYYGENSYLSLSQRDRAPFKQEVITNE